MLMFPPTESREPSARSVRRFYKDRNINVTSLRWISDEHVKKMVTTNILQMKLNFVNCISKPVIWKLKDSIPLLRMHQTLIFGQDVAKSKDARRVRGTQRQFSENICLKDDLRSRVFGTFVVKFLACLPLLGFFEHLQNGITAYF